MTEDDHVIDSVAALEELYGAPHPASLIKEKDRIIPTYRQMIEASPFVILASVGPDGVDCSPRGDPAPVVIVEDKRTLFLPDRPGNNRTDALRNIVADPRVALLFLIPGVGETLRVNGRARISVAPELLRRFETAGKPPRSVLVIAAEQVYFQCPKALVRSRLWDPAARVDRSAAPTAGQMLEDASETPFDGAKFDASYPERIKKTIY